MDVLKKLFILRYRFCWKLTFKVYLYSLRFFQTEVCRLLQKLILKSSIRADKTKIINITVRRTYKTKSKDNGDR
jgi:hypothetical protein